MLVGLFGMTHLASCLYKSSWQLAHSDNAVLFIKKTLAGLLQIWHVLFILNSLRLLVLLKEF